MPWSILRPPPPQAAGASWCEAARARPPRQLAFRPACCPWPCMRGLLRFATLFAVVFAVWLYGLFAFVAHLPERVEDPDRHTDAIVVPTGGSERLAEGVRLLTRGLAGKLFISGVNAQPRLVDLIASLPPDIEKPSPALVDCCIVLGHAA